METLPPLPLPASLADSLLALARRRGVAVADDGSLGGPDGVSNDGSIATLLAAIEPRPLIPHPLLLVAGAVMAVAFRHDRRLAVPPAGDAPPSADCSF
ncbi:hypothetical protein [Azospirillum doebereinerae]|uniref:Uncharacterized protein n=1 Tax=Azospirillum doebereinerae TaxID=92933 RepID=A0A433J418_9PROT|nr:hypothetical protein [Azospirillum doebereinerae]MCG5243508.1 hypothetical protein [Azospirillum doebereinerae]RUQ66598.1 hypothetical protein EJ913_22490 [Azospirillum doebereinerae]